MQERSAVRSDLGSADGDFQLGTSERGTTTTVELAGDWDIAGVPAVQQALDAALARDPECLVFDLTRLRFMDSTGVSATVQLSKRCITEGVRLVILIEAQRSNGCSRCVAWTII